MTTRQTALKPRKRPTQQRSRATVEAILQAAAYILVKRGWQALTTNAVAERAGVNIASLYQFFPNKESILAELERRHVAETRASMAEVFARHQGDSIEARVRTLVQAALAAHAVAPELHREFADRLPRHRRGDEVLARFIEGGRAELFALGLPHPELAAWMIATVSHAAVHEGIVERRADVDSGAFADELVELIVRYVERPRFKRAVPSGA
jgi:AcrR family transcriptional regulator